MAKKVAALEAGGISPAGKSGSLSGSRSFSGLPVSGDGGASGGGGSAVSDTDSVCLLAASLFNPTMLCGRMENSTSARVHVHCIIVCVHANNLGLEVFLL